jgi:membrane protein implicated in regulation of membrane protease activity
MAWWMWVVGGIVLLLVEVLTPGGFFVVFFGVGAILVGALQGLGWEGPGWAQWLVFTVLSVVSLAIFREPLMRRFSLGKSKPVDQLAGERALVTEDVAPGGVGKAEMRGASWTARTSGAVALARGQRCLVERVDGLTLWLKAE